MIQKIIMVHKLSIFNFKDIFIWSLKYKLLILCKFSPSKLIFCKFFIYNVLNNDLPNEWNYIYINFRDIIFAQLF